MTELLTGLRVCALTGAGISTESGIPDYRGPTAKPRNPIQHRAFVTEAKTRARYWARSTFGWPTFRAFAPNPGHVAMAALQRRGVITGLITQNVDRLHQKAGSTDVLELHGALHEVRCLSCGQLESRDALQARMLALNPSAESWSAELAPDGDAELPAEAMESFNVPGCLTCEGLLKPDVVFFGDNVPAPRVEAAFSMVAQADALLVVGSSLTVYSGYRFAVRAHELKKPVIIINQGTTRADDLATLKVEARTSAALTDLARSFSSTRQHH